MQTKSEIVLCRELIRVTGSLCNTVKIKKKSWDRQNSGERRDKFLISSYGPVVIRFRVYLQFAVYLHFNVQYTYSLQRTVLTVYSVITITVNLQFAVYLEFAVYST